MQLSGTPVLILKEGTERSRGKDAQKNNIAASKIIAEAVRTTLGPRGMDKMLVDSLGDVTITNDGATILDEIDVQHPAAKMMVEIAKTQDQEVGDGTTTAVVIAGELLKKSEELIEAKIHPTTIAAGYRKAALKAQEALKNMATEIDINSKSINQVVITSLNSKAIKGYKARFADIAVRAVQAVKEKRGEKWFVDIDQIQIQKKRGKSLADTEMIDGIVIDKEIVHTDMPKSIKNAKIALLNIALEIKKTEFDSEIRITDPTQIQAFLDEEEKILKGFVEKIKNVGATMVFAQKGIDDTAQHFLATAGISAVRRVKKSDMEKLQRATGAAIIMNLDDLKEDDLGVAGFIEERKIGDDKMVFVTEAKQLKAVSIVIRGGVEHVVDEAERGLHDALCVAKDVIIDNKIVGGGGASEIEIAKQLRDYAAKVGGREQLAVEAFAEAMEVIPKTLSENAGLDPIDILVKLRAKHESNGKNIGIDVFDGEIKDMLVAGITEPLVVKVQAIKSSAESASMILRIDDVIASKASEGPPMPPGGMGGMPPGMGGMGGYPGMM
ncbi:MAG: thermosome subunit beta [Promethearchaeota archaeon]